jgi:tRNA modification GTPase
LLNIFVQLEGTIDFPEEELELLSRNELLNKIESLNLNIANIISSYEWGKILRDGARICIAGQPNVGKSSLLNALLGEERVIVTAEPGTTRDYIEESLNLDGLPLVLWDTAGIRPTNSYLEKAGIDVTLARLKEAHGVILVLDGSASISDKDWSILSKIIGDGEKIIIVINKNDLCQKIDIKNLKNVIPNNRIVNVSCKNNTGLDDLKILLRALFVNDINNHEIVLANLRHKTALERANLNLTEAANSLRDCLPPELVAVDLQAAQQALEEIVGIVSNDELIDRIFNQFCIGK